MTIRTEREQDVDQIRRVNVAAFGRAAEADIVDRLRKRNALLVSLVADCDGAVVGHIAFSSVVIAGHPAIRGAGLGPMAVVPAEQRRGVGSALVRAGLDRCQELGVDLAVVLGHPEYYPRFGFSPAARFDVRCAWDVPAGVFMAQELRPGALRGVTGVIRYEPEFDIA